MEITTTTTKRGRINVHADGEYLFTVPAFIWYGSSLLGKTQAQPEELEALQRAGLLYDAEDKALRLLSIRAHSEKELTLKLKQKYPAEIITAVTEKLRNNGLLDDEKFANMYAEELVRRKNFSSDRIRNELLSKGIDREIAENAVNALDIDKNTGIINIINKMHLPENPTRKDVDRLLRRLLSAGYTMRDIREVISFSQED